MHNEETVAVEVPARAGKLNGVRIIALCTWPFVSLQSVIMLLWIFGAVYYGVSYKNLQWSIILLLLALCYCGAWCFVIIASLAIGQKTMLEHLYQSDEQQYQNAMALYRPIREFLALIQQEMTLLNDVRANTYVINQHLKELSGQLRFRTIVMPAEPKKRGRRSTTSETAAIQEDHLSQQANSSLS